MVVLIVLAAVLLQVVAAVLLKEMADRPELPLMLVAMGIGVVGVLGGTRFLIWGYAHRRYPLSHSYPLSSMFFPLMLAVAWAYGDPVHLTQLLGTGLITVGVVWLVLRVRP